MALGAEMALMALVVLVALGGSPPVALVVLGVLRGHGARSRATGGHRRLESTL